MAGDYYDVGQFRERNGKWRFQKLGSAKENDKGGWDIFLDALPLQDGPNQCRLTITQPRDKSDGGSRRVNSECQDTPF